MSEAIAKAKYIRGSALKARLVADAVRGMPAMRAMEVLKYMPKGAAPKVRKVVQSALANAVNNSKLDPQALIITKITIDEAPTLKRGRAESKGRYRKILKRNSHITVVLGQAVDKAKKEKVVKEAVQQEVPVEKAPKAKKAVTKKAAPKKATTVKKNKK